MKKLLFESIKTKFLKFRLVEEDDAPFILELRTDHRYNKYLSTVIPDLDKQKEWLHDYKQREQKGQEYYFIITDKIDQNIGTVRLYDFLKESFCWGSWILNEKKPRLGALESAMLVYKIGFDLLDFQQSHFDVMCENIRVIEFHKKFGAEIVSTDEQNVYFILKKQKFKNSIEKFNKFFI